MNLRSYFAFCLIILVASLQMGFAQADYFVGQFTSSNQESFAGTISGDGRLVVFESRGDVATENPRNADGNTEIFLWDYAQRRIFQITDTKSVLKNTFGTATQANIRVEIVNKRPVISQNGRWIAFSSNATASIISPSDQLNPGSFDGNFYNTQDPLPTTGCPEPTPSPSPTASPSPSPTPTGSPSPTPTPAPTSTPFNNPLQCDANMEVWLYEVPALEPADLVSGDPVALTNLSGGAFTRLTNTPPSRYPQPGEALRAPFVADDNHDPAVNDDAGITAFVSTRNLIAGGNTDENDEIFAYARGSGTVSQVTSTPRGTIPSPIYNRNPSLSGNGARVVFASTGNNPIVGMTGGNNPESSRNEEIFISDLDGAGAPTGLRRQVTVTTPTNPGDLVNLLAYGKRISRDGNIVAFDSYADLTNENGGTNYTTFATYLYNVSTNTFRRIGPRSGDDTAAQGGDVAHFPGFTNYDESGSPRTLVLQTRQNILPNGTVATTESQGLNPITNRPVQFYFYPLDVPAASATFTRVTRFPISTNFLAQSQPLTSDTSERLAFNLALTELGGGNTDLLGEAFYLYVPNSNSQTTQELDFVTGATSMPILPTGSPTPTPSPTATPAPTPTPTATPTPMTPAAVKGISPGMLARIVFDEPLSPAVTPRTAIGNLEQSFSLPISLSGISLSIGGYAAGIRSVSSNSIEFVVPPGFSVPADGANFPVSVFNQGSVLRGFVTLVAARPDVFNDTGGPGGRAQALNVTNRVHVPEPFTVTTVKIKGGMRVPTLLRLRVTGVQGASAANFSIRIGNVTIPAANVKTGAVLIEPGVYTVDFELPPSLNGAGDQPIVLSIVAGSLTFTTRLDDTAPRIRIL